MLRNAKFKHRFEYDTGYPIDIYKTDTELAAAFILHREEVEFEYGKRYPDHGIRRCEVDFVLSVERIFKPLPGYLNVVQWPEDKPVRWVEIKRNVQNRYTPKPKEEIEAMMKAKKWRRGGTHALLQREFLKRHGVETLPLGEDELAYFYSNGLLADK